MAFNPTIETQPQPMQQVAQAPSALGAIVGLFDNAGVFNQKQAPSQSDTRARDDRNFFTTMDSINQQVASGQITAEQGQVAYRNTYRGYTSVYGVGSNPETDKLFSANTGMDPMIATTGGDNSVTNLRADPMFDLGREFARQQNPNASPEELDNSALNYVSRNKANKAAVESAKNAVDASWVQRQPAYDALWLDVTTTFQQMAASVEQDGLVTPEEGQQLRGFVSAQMAQFQQPEGVDTATWKGYIDNKMSTMTALTSANIKAVLDGNYDSDSKRAFATLYSMAAVKGGLTPTMIYTLNSAQGDSGEAIKLLSQMNQNNPDNGLAMANKILGMSYQELKDYALNFEYQDAGFLDRVDTTDFTKMSDGDKVSSMLSADIPMLKVSDPVTSLTGITNIVEKVAALPYTKIDGPLLNQLFSPAYFSAISRLNDKNPAIGAALIDRTNTALSQQQSALSTHIQEVAKRNGFTARVVTRPNGTQQVDFFPDPALVSPAAKAELDKYFGGDWNRAQAANGVVAAGRYGNVTPTLTNMFSEIKSTQSDLEIFNKIDAARAQLNGKLPKPIEQPTNPNATPEEKAAKVDSSTPQWQQQNLTTIQASNGQKWQVNKQAAEAFQGFIAELESMGYNPVSSGGYNYRNIRGSNKLSEHATGNAIDINATANALGSTTQSLS